MTETAVVNETVNTENTESAEATPEVKLPEFPADSMAGMLIDRARSTYDNLKGVADKLNRTGDRGKLISEAIEQSKDPEVQKLNAQIAKAHDAINKLTAQAETLVKPTLEIPSEEEIKELQSEQKRLAALFGTYDTTFVAEVKAEYPELTLDKYFGALPKAKGTNSKATGTGPSRPRVSSVEVSHDNGKTYKKVTLGVKKDGSAASTFSALIMFLKSDAKADVSASDLHNAWLESQHVDSWDKVTEVSTFNYSVNGKSYMVRVTK